ncbi:uncharacterized protein LOC117492824 isoform X2 [Trematomus bernacchii]|uniref:uncharacterized protein LOC117492824 isoform X2 n=1 Tax=Trematomus bernacchii TaxID=40690 RepID=UPI00146C4FAC|nr:uncharacterized protein LOC117492824 isoform X2 [Trematomus bernacchii]
MDAAMFQLRSFVHQRLYTAAEEILGEVEKTIKLAFEAGPSKDEAGRLQDLLDLRMKAGLRLLCRAFTDQQHSGK